MFSKRECAFGELRLGLRVQLDENRGALKLFDLRRGTGRSRPLDHGWRARIRPGEGERRIAAGHSSSRGGAPLPAMRNTSASSVTGLRSTVFPTEGTGG